MFSALTHKMKLKDFGERPVKSIKDATKPVLNQLPYSPKKLGFKWDLQDPVSLMFKNQRHQSPFCCYNFDLCFLFSPFFRAISVMFVFPIVELEFFLVLWIKELWCKSGGGECKTFPVFKTTVVGRNVGPDQWCGTHPGFALWEASQNMMRLYMSVCSFLRSDVGLHFHWAGPSRSFIALECSYFCKSSSFISVVQSHCLKGVCMLHNHQGFDQQIKRLLLIFVSSSRSSIIPCQFSAILIYWDVIYISTCFFLSPHAEPSTASPKPMTACFGASGGIVVQAWGPLGSGSLGISASSACEAWNKPPAFFGWQDFAMVLDEDCWFRDPNVCPSAFCDTFLFCFMMSFTEISNTYREVWINKPHLNARNRLGKTLFQKMMH